MRTYRIKELADDVGVHPNTVRLYEQWGFLSPALREPNGYRVFTQQHKDQLRLARLAARGDLDQAKEKARGHLKRIRRERRQAVEALYIRQHWTKGAHDGHQDNPCPVLTRKKAAGELGVTVDVLRDWERNGLIRVPRDRNTGYRLYGTQEMQRLRVIRTLRAAHYSQMAILRMMRRFDSGQTEGLEEALNTPESHEDLVYATDRWVRALKEVWDDALEMIRQLERMGAAAGADTSQLE